MLNKPTFPCPNCQIGLCYARHTTFLTIYDNLLVSASNTPVWECDICQYQDFDQETIERLEKLLDGADALPESQRITTKLTSIEPNKPVAARRIKP